MLTEEPTSVLREILVGIVLRVTIHQESIEIQVSKQGIWARFQNQGKIPSQKPHEEPIVLTVAMTLKGCGGEMRLIISGCAGIDQRRQPVVSLIKAVSRASDSVRRMESGECKHQRAVAKATGLEPRYINSIVRVAFLAPEIVEAIIDGRQGADLTLGFFTDVLPMFGESKRNLSAICNP